MYRRPRILQMREACAWSVFWITIAIAFNFYIYFTRGTEAALLFFTSYLVEQSLSMDNLFVFLIIFKYFKTPQMYLQRVLYWGIFGAILMRALCIVAGIGLLRHFHVTIYFLGVFLLYTSYKMIFQEHLELDPENSKLIKFIKKILPFSKKSEHGSFFVKEDGHWKGTRLFMTLIAIEVTDLIFALDSIPAVLAITSDLFIVFTSNILAIMGLRAFYFVLSHFMGRFAHLHYALSAILGFIGVNMLLSDIVEVPIYITLGFTVVTLTTAVITSLAWTSKPPSPPGDLPHG